MRNRILTLLALGVAAGAPCFGALTSFNVTLDMTALPTANYYFDFNMADADGVANNTVNISNFAITDTLIGSLNLTPPASGDLTTGLVLPDNAPGGFSDANQQFSHTSGSGSLSFTFSYDPAFAGGRPDEFSFSILDSTFTTIANPASNGGLIQLDFSSTSALPVTFAALNPAFGGIDPTLMESPEPASIVLTGAGAALLLLLAYRRGKTCRQR